MRVVRTRQELSDLLERGPRVWALGLATNGQSVIPGGAELGRLVGVALFQGGEDSRALYVPLGHREDNAEPDVRYLLDAFLVEGGQFLVRDARWTAAAARLFFQRQPFLVFDVVIGSRVIAPTEEAVEGEPSYEAADYSDRRPEETAAVFGESLVRTFYLAQVQCRLAGEAGLSWVWSVEASVAGFMAAQTLQGYLRGDGVRVHPEWRTLAASGSSRIVSANPSLSSLRRQDRLAFLADRTRRWVGLSWPALDLASAAVLSGDPVLAEFAGAGDPYGAMAAVVGATPDEAKALWFTAVQHGPGQDPRGQALATAAHRWAEWCADLSTAPPGGVWAAGFGRRLWVAESRKATAMIIADCSAFLLKMVLLLLGREAQHRKEHQFAGFGSVIPVYTQLFYQIDRNVLVGDHVGAVQQVCALLVHLLPEAFAPYGRSLAPVVSMGPSWGDLHPVEHDFGQLTADLVSLAEPVVVCPVCGRWAVNQETMDQHSAEFHKGVGPVR